MIGLSHLNPRIANQFEPEGIFLSAPLTGVCTLLQGWGEHPDFHGRVMYNGVQLKGHPGLDFATDPGTEVYAIEAGRVVEINIDVGGFGRHIKLEHTWGESFYAQLGEVLVESGQRIERGQLIARTDRQRTPYAPHLHLGIRIAPFNRFDGWGGFCDPLPYLYATEILLPTEGDADEFSEPVLPRISPEHSKMRRP
ncbi:MAG: M23 family metallopeptidase [Anaerolineales bacterium]|nr:M23 family metallopeptidase [Anaerolineales bacterium]